MNLASPLNCRPAVLTLATVSLAIFVAPAPHLLAQSLVGSRESLARQNLVAQQHGYPYLRTRDELFQAVSSGELVEVLPNGDLDLAGSEVSYPYARPEVKVFLEQLAQAYRSQCGEPLVVTSLARPVAEQPWNASPLSVHPTGMAVDLRRSDRRACRLWLERSLLVLENEGMIEAIRERWPAHYHVAVFPDPLLLPGPLGDPNGVARLAALHSGPIDREAAALETARSGRGHRLHVARSTRTGRIEIIGRRAGRHSGRVAIARTTSRRGKGRHAATGSSAVRPRRTSHPAVTGAGGSRSGHAHAVHVSRSHRGARSQSAR